MQAMRLRYLRTALRRSLPQLWSSRIGASLSMRRTGYSVASWDIGVKRRGEFRVDMLIVLKN